MGGGPRRGRRLALQAKFPLCVLWRATQPAPWLAKQARHAQGGETRQGEIHQRGECAGAQAAASGEPAALRAMPVGAVAFQYCLGSVLSQVGIEGRADSGAGALPACSTHLAAAAPTLPAWRSPVRAVTLKDGCSARRRTTSSPVYPEAPSTATRTCSPALAPAAPAAGACGVATGAGGRRRWLPHMLLAPVQRCRTGCSCWLGGAVASSGAAAAAPRAPLNDPAHRSDCPHSDAPPPAPARPRWRASRPHARAAATNCGHERLLQG